MNHDDLDQYGHRNCITIDGIPEGKDENTMQLFIDMAKDKLKMTVSPYQIERCHRLGKVREPTAEKPHPRPRKIIVKFSAYEYRYKVYGARTNLKGLSLYINEHLTNHRSHIFHLARMVKKKGDLKNVWTSNGNIRVKDLGDKIYNIREAVDLLQFADQQRPEGQNKDNRPPPAINEPPKPADTTHTVTPVDALWADIASLPAVSQVNKNWEPSPHPWDDNDYDLD